MKFTNFIYIIVLKLKQTSKSINKNLFPFCLLLLVLKYFDFQCLVTESLINNNDTSISEIALQDILTSPYKRPICV